MERDAAIIEVGLNEAATRAENPHVPYAPEEIFLSGAWAVGPFPTEEALDFHLQQIPPDLDVEWVLVPYALDDPALVERLCRHALARGGGIRLGIGDDPAAFPESTNAALVERAA